jgi:hypothetical protein
MRRSVRAVAGSGTADHVRVLPETLNDLFIGVMGLKLLFSTVTELKMSAQLAMAVLPSMVKMLVHICLGPKQIREGRVSRDNLED